MQDKWELPAKRKRRFSCLLFQWNCWGFHLCGSPGLAGGPGKIFPEEFKERHLKKPRPNKKNCEDDRTVSRNVTQWPPLATGIWVSWKLRRRVPPAMARCHAPSVYGQGHSPDLHAKCYYLYNPLILFRPRLFLATVFSTIWRYVWIAIGNPKFMFHLIRYLCSSRKKIGNIGAVLYNEVVHGEI